MTLRLYYEEEGSAKVVHDLQGLGARFLATEPILKAIGAELRGIEESLFEAEGYGTWKPLAASTIEKKGHSRILVDSEDLKKSLTEEGAEGHIEIVRFDELYFGTNLLSEDGAPYPVYLRTGTRYMPSRDPLQVREVDVKRFSKSIQAYLMGAEHGAYAALQDAGTFFTGETATFGVG